MARKADYIDVRELNGGQFSMITLRDMNDQPAVNIEFSRSLGAISVAPVGDSGVLLRGPYAGMELLHEGQYVPLPEILNLIALVGRVSTTEDPVTQMVGLDLIRQGYEKMRGTGQVK